MKNNATLLALLLLAGLPARAATPIYVTADVPTLESGGTELAPWQIYRYDAVGPTYTLQLTVPGAPHLDAIHKLDVPASWLFSVEAPNDLGGALPGPAEPQDVVRFDGGLGSYSLFFCGAVLGIPLGVNLDSVHLAGGDAGPLIASFDVPLELPAGSGTFFEPADLVRFDPTGGGSCSDWMLSGVNPAFDASAAGAGIPLSDNLVGADDGGGRLILAMDVPSDLAPSVGPPTYVPGLVAAWDGAAFDLFEALVGWPAGSIVDGLACEANPGRVDPAIGPLLLTKSGADLVLSWSASCASGGVEYGIYEGTIAAIHGGVYDHVRIDCQDSAPPLTETITPGGGSHSYLVVPNNAKEEGSYGLNSALVERPQAAAPVDRCVVPQNLVPCP